MKLNLWTKTEFVITRNQQLKYQVQRQMYSLYDKLVQIVHRRSFCFIDKIEIENNSHQQNNLNRHDKRPTDPKFIKYVETHSHSSWK